MFVQSPLSQPMVHRNRTLYEKMAAEDNSPIKDYVSEQGTADIKRVEGILIEAYNQYYGKLPAWNKVGGSIAGQQRVMQNNINIVKSFSNPQLYAANTIVSRSTIRELSDNPSFERYESYLHTVRMYALMMGIDFDDALAFTNKWDTFGWYKKMCDAGYLKKELFI